MSTTYAVHTATCSFFLDAEGICRSVVPAPHRAGRSSAKTSAQCIGAQFVASLDAAVPGCLVELPKVGTALLFAKVGSDGRIALVRTGIVTSLESFEGTDPFVTLSSVHTSAPEFRSAAEPINHEPAREFHSEASSYPTPAPNLSTGTRKRPSMLDPAAPPPRPAAASDDDEETAAIPRAYPRSLTKR